MSITDDTDPLLGLAVPSLDDGSFSVCKTLVTGTVILNDSLIWTAGAGGRESFMYRILKMH